MNSRPPRAPGDPADGTRRFYETHADSYASATEAAPMQHLVSRFAASLSPRSLVLDLGAGAGRDLKTFGTIGFKPIGLDYSMGLAHRAQVLAHRPVVCGDMRRIPIRSHSVAGVWAAASMLHLDRSEVPSVLVDIRRALEPGGMLFASVKRGSGGARDKAGRWFTYFEVPEWRALLVASGFDVATIQVDHEAGLRGGESAPVMWIVSLAAAMP